MDQPFDPDPIEEEELDGDEAAAEMNLPAALVCQMGEEVRQMIAEEARQLENRLDDLLRC